MSASVLKTSVNKKSPEFEKNTRKVIDLVAQIKNDPQELQRACAALEDSLAEMYLALAESWLRAGQREQEAAALQKILHTLPDSRHAKVAQDRLRQIG